MNRGESNAPYGSPLTPDQGRTPVPATRLSRTVFFADFYAFPTAAVAFIALALASEPHRWMASVMAVVIGVAVWTLVEYLLHR